MAGSISLNSTLGGTVVITAVDSANTTYLTIPTGINAMSTGPIAIAAGVTVTIPSGSTWAII
jgi:hypothetical protein